MHDSVDSAVKGSARGHAWPEANVLPAASGPTPFPTANDTSSHLVCLSESDFQCVYIDGNESSEIDEDFVQSAELIASAVQARHRYKDLDKGQHEREAEHDKVTHDRNPANTCLSSCATAAAAAHTIPPSAEDASLRLEFEHGIFRFDGMQTKLASWEQFVDDVAALYRLIESGPCLSTARTRLAALSEKFRLYSLVNGAAEAAYTQAAAQQSSMSESATSSESDGSDAAAALASATHEDAWHLHDKLHHRDGRLHHVHTAYASHTKNSERYTRNAKREDEEDEEKDAGHVDGGRTTVLCESVHTPCPSSPRCTFEAEDDVFGGGAGAARVYGSYTRVDGGLQLTTLCPAEAVREAIVHAALHTPHIPFYVHPVTHRTQTLSELLRDYGVRDVRCWQLEDIHDEEDEEGDDDEDESDAENDEGEHANGEKEEVCANNRSLEACAVRETQSRTPALPEHDDDEDEQEDGAEEEEEGDGATAARAARALTQTLLHGLWCPQCPHRAELGAQLLRRECEKQEYDPLRRSASEVMLRITGRHADECVQWARWLHRHGFHRYRRNRWNIVLAPQSGRVECGASYQPAADTPHCIRASSSVCACACAAGPSHGARTVADRLHHVFHPLLMATCYPDDPAWQAVATMLNHTSAVVVPCATRSSKTALERRYVCPGTVCDEEEEHAMAATRDARHTRLAHRRRRRRVMSELWFCYHVWCNVAVLNALRRRHGRHTLRFTISTESHAPAYDALLGGFLLADTVRHARSLAGSWVMRYVFTLCQVGVVMSPLRDAVCGTPEGYLHHPVVDYFRQGMCVSLSTADPLYHHHRRDCPVLEEYATLMKLRRLSAMDMAELARWSVLNSNFPRELRERWLGTKGGRMANDVRRSRVADFRLRFRCMCHRHEEMLLQAARERCASPGAHEGAAGGRRQQQEEENTKAAEETQRWMEAAVPAWTESSGPRKSSGNHNTVNRTNHNDVVDSSSSSSSRRRANMMTPELNHVAGSAMPHSRRRDDAAAFSAHDILDNHATRCEVLHHIDANGATHESQVQSAKPNFTPTTLSLSASSPPLCAWTAYPRVRVTPVRRAALCEPHASSCSLSSSPSRSHAWVRSLREVVLLRAAYTNFRVVDVHVEDVFRRSASFDESIWQYRSYYGVLWLFRTGSQPQWPSFIPPVRQFVRDVARVRRVVCSPRLQRLCRHRLRILERTHGLHVSMNRRNEAGARDRKSWNNRDVFTAHKVDTHVHTEAGCNARTLLDFFVEKAQHHGEDVVWEEQERPVTLRELLARLKMDCDHITVDELHHQLHTHADFRALFLSVENYMQGRYFAELTRRTLQIYQEDAYSFAENRLTLRGASESAWVSLAHWFDRYGMASSQNRWMVCFEHSYAELRRSGEVANFGDYLDHLFRPLWQVSLHPAQDTKLHYFLAHVSGFDCFRPSTHSTHIVRAPRVHTSSSSFLFAPSPPPHPSAEEEDNYAQQMNEDEEEPPVPLTYPHDYTAETNPPYNMYLYYLWANIVSLNAFRASRELGTFSFRPQCGERGSVDHLIGGFLLARSISQGVTLAAHPVMEYMYYLAQIGIAMSPLSNTAKAAPYLANPFPRFLFRGLNVTLATNQPLYFHLTREPLLEEYSMAAKLWHLELNDLAEIARNSVRQSGFPPVWKRRALGPLYALHSPLGNDVRYSHVSNIRVAHRFETYHHELDFLDAQLAAGEGKERMPRAILSMAEERRVYDAHVAACSVSRRRTSCGQDDTVTPPAVVHDASSSSLSSLSSLSLLDPVSSDAYADAMGAVSCTEEENEEDVMKSGQNGAEHRDTDADRVCRSEERTAVSVTTVSDDLLQGELLRIQMCVDALTQCNTDMAQTIDRLCAQPSSS